MEANLWESVHSRPEVEASIRRWIASGRTCAPMIGWGGTEDGHVVSYVCQMAPVAWDVRMSCPDAGKMATKNSRVFTCIHGAFDADYLIGMQTVPDEEDMTWADFDESRP